MRVRGAGVEADDQDRSMLLNALEAAFTMQIM